MEPLLLTAVLGGLALLYSIYRLLTRPSISDIPGPESKSFWLGTSFSLPCHSRGAASVADRSLIPPIV